MHALSGNNPRRRLWTLAAVLAGCLLAVARPAAAQDGAAEGDIPAGDSQPLSGPAVSVGEVRIDLERFGVGNMARRGDWCGIRLKLRDNGSKQRDVIVRITGIDDDGDYPQYQRTITLNPGVDQGVWIYMRLPFKYQAGDQLTATVHEAVAGGTEPDGSPGFRAARLLGTLALEPIAQRVLRPTDGLIGVLGDRALGLLKYADRRGNDPWHALGHEVTEIATGIRPGDLPDHWQGLMPMEALIWGAGELSELSADRAKAVRQWVERGGHLVIILPPVGQTWSNPQSNELHDIMPIVAVQRQESVDLAAYRPLLNMRAERLFPKTGAVHTFRRLPDTQIGEAVEVMNGPDGKCVVVRRLVGAGAVTMVGLDLNQTVLAQADAIDAEVFWHRLLGRRGLLSTDDAEASGPGAAGLGIFTREQWAYDRDIEKAIAQTGRTAIGVLIGFVVFVAYWLVAGPVGYGVLKARGLVRHAWLGFLAATAGFTVLAWGGATLLRPGKTGAQHVTFLDHVYGQPTQRARMWASVLIPRYGTARIGVGTPADAGRSLNTIAAWDPPGDAGAWANFPDARGYAVRSNNPDTIEVPIRSTVKQVQVDWAGGPLWEMPIPVGPEGAGTGELTLTPDWVPASGSGLVNGSLVHRLPGTLRDLTIIVVRRQTPMLNPRVKGKPRNDFTRGYLACEAYGWSLRDWEPGTPLDLGLKTALETAAGRSGADLAFPGFWAGLAPPSRTHTDSMANDRRDAGDINYRFTSLALFPLIPPPDFDDNANVDYAAQRSAAHGWDLSRWFTQPCVIIIGHLGTGEEAVASPVPLTVDGEPVPSKGRTVVRWVYPLPGNPPAFPLPDAEPAPPPNTTLEGGG